VHSAKVLHGCFGLVFARSGSSVGSEQRATVPGSRASECSSIIGGRIWNCGVQAGAVANHQVEILGIFGVAAGLDVLVYDFRRGRSAEAIFEAYSSIGSLAKVYGAITFILEHPDEVEAYLKDQDRILEELN
jgi:hypothetical protein